MVGINIILPVRIPMYLHFDFSFTLVFLCVNILFLCSLFNLFYFMFLLTSLVYHFPPHKGLYVCCTHFQGHKMSMLLILLAEGSLNKTFYVALAP